MKTLDFSKDLPKSNLHNHWLPSRARKCRNAGLSAEEATLALKAVDGVLYRRYHPNEVEDVVALVYGTDVPKGKKKDAWPVWCPEHTAGIHAALRMDQEFLRIVSFDDVEGMRARDFLDALFGRGDPLLCCGYSTGWRDVFTKRRSEYGPELDRMAQVVPKIMTARSGITQKGDDSPRAKTNTGETIYIVVDLDFPPEEQHASIIWHLKRFMPLAMVMHSGAKGLHGWFLCTDQSKITDLYRYACACGADGVFYRTKNQFARMPGGLRDNGKRQRVLYLDQNYCYEPEPAT